MSIVLSVFLSDDAVPESVEWQNAITRCGFDLQLDKDFDVRAFSGFLPAVYCGRKAGFEFSLFDVNLDEFDGAKREAARKWTKGVELTTHSDVAEAVSAAIAGGVLAELAGGVLHDDQSGETFQPNEAAEWSKAIETECRPHL